MCLPAPNADRFQPGQRVGPAALTDGHAHFGHDLWRVLHLSLACRRQALPRPQQAMGSKQRVAAPAALGCSRSVPVILVGVDAISLPGAKRLSQVLCDVCGRASYRTVDDCEVGGDALPRSLRLRAQTEEVLVHLLDLVSSDIQQCVDVGATVAVRLPDADA